MPVDFRPTANVAQKGTTDLKQATTSAAPPTDFRPDHPDAPQVLKRTPFVGIHFSHDKVTGDTLLGARRGMNAEGADHTRVHAGRGAPAGVHVYREGTVADTAIAKRPHHYKVAGEHSLATIEDEPLWADILQSTFDKAKSHGAQPDEALAVAINEAEHALHAAGYTGYQSKAAPHHVFLFGDHKVVAGDAHSSTPVKSGKGTA